MVAKTVGGEIDWQIVRDVQQKVLDQQMPPIY